MGARGGAGGGGGMCRGREVKKEEEKKKFKMSRFGIFIGLLPPERLAEKGRGAQNKIICSPGQLYFSAVSDCWSVARV